MCIFQLDHCERWSNIIVIFLRDRFRTCVNVMGDALGAGIVNRLSRDDIKFSELDANEETPLRHSDGALDEEAEEEEEDLMKMTRV